MDSWRLFTKELQDLDVVLFHIGTTELTVSSLIKLVVFLAFLIWFAARVQAWVVRWAERHSGLDIGSQQAIGSVIRYVVLITGTVLTLQNIGINLTAFTMVAGALGVGVGFGLQNVFSNFISGLIIMIERPIKVGDRVELANIEGTVKDIGARRTTIITHDHVAILVPNQRFITDNVVSLAYAGQPIRLRIPVQVAAATDPSLMKRLLLEAARSQADVLQTPEPQVLLTSLGGGATMFELAVWHTPLGVVRQQLFSALAFQISEKLRAAEILRA